GNTQRTSNTEAYVAFLRGLEATRLVGEGHSRRAVASFERAVELDPGYANAWALLGLSYGVAADFAGTPSLRSEFFGRAAAAVDKAIALAPDLAIGYRARATRRNFMDWDWAGAAEDFEPALALDPNDPATPSTYSHAVFLAGRRRAATATPRRAAATDPLAGDT